MNEKIIANLQSRVEILEVEHSVATAEIDAMEKELKKAKTKRAKIKENILAIERDIRAKIGRPKREDIEERKAVREANDRKERVEIELSFSNDDSYAAIANSVGDTKILSKECAKKACANLTNKELVVCYKHIVLGMTFPAIGKELGLTRGRVRDFHSFAVKKLKHPRVRRCE